MNKFKTYFIGVVLPVLLLGVITFFALYWHEKTALGAPAVFIATPATSSPTALQNFSFVIGTTTPRGAFGSSTLAVYGSSTIQTWANTTHALEIFDSATTTVFRVDTLNRLASTSALNVSNLISCDTIDTNANGVLSCGTDSGGGAAPFPVLTIGGTVHAASSTLPFYFGSGLLTSSSTIGTLTAGAITATSSLTVTGITSALTLTNGSGLLSGYTGTSCTNQFPRSLSALGVATCATVSASDVSLANLTATDGTLTFSGTYNGSTARTIGLNLGQANTWTALQNLSSGLISGASSTFSALLNASSTLSISPLAGTSLFQTSTSTGGSAWFIDSNGRLSYGSSSPSNHALVIDKGAAFTTEMPLTDGATIDVNFRSANQGAVTLAGNRAIRLQGGYPGQTYRLFVSQDGTGSRKMTGWSSVEGWSVLFGSASQTATTTPESSLKANVTCLISFIVTKGTSSPIYWGTLESCTY